MLRTAPLALAGALALALSAADTAAQNTIALGQTLTGRLDSADSTLDDDSYYEIWRFRGQAGERVRITLRSDDFDAYLAFGTRAGADCDDCETDDDGAGGTDARIVATLDRTGDYEIRVNTLSEGEMGDFTLAVERAGPGDDDTDDDGDETVRVTGAITPGGGTASGTLDESDPRLGDDSYAEYWSYRARAGERLVITMKSDAFDTYLVFGRRDADGTFDTIESNDDGDEDGDGTDSRLEVTVDEAGEYVIRANSLSGGETGAYTLRVERR
ncbi:MAG TPA: hypothetical protein VHG91_20670 [Longimicrobium sp.]|nr:hypothetical protein [Longimicrobium sp.]